jgi:hypothetical protein
MITAADDFTIFDDYRSDERVGSDEGGALCSELEGKLDVIEVGHKESSCQLSVVSCQFAALVIQLRNMGRLAKYGEQQITK